MNTQTFKGILIGIVILFVSGCSQTDTHIEELYATFQNPPTEARPFVRWWWNGNRVNSQEVIRELDLLKKAGFGGVEINPIAMPPYSKEPDQEALEWLSHEWIEVVKTACLEAQERGMVADLLVGSGWPFGGKFLEHEQTIERMAVNYRDVEGSQQLRLKTEDLINDLPNTYIRGRLEKETPRTLEFVRIIPINLSSHDQIIDLKAMMTDDQVDYELPKGDYLLSWGVLQKGYREVVHGAPGADGPTMNHYDAEVTRAFLNRLLEIEEYTGIPLKDLIRALFCDSMELAGSNWTKDFAQEFEKRCGYSLDPYYPFVFYYYDEPYPIPVGDAAFADEILRVRYDYNRVLVDLFHERFTRVFQQFANEHQIKTRFQAYGIPWFMGILDGYMITDIPESNNWLYSQGTEPDDHDYFSWVKNHGYMIWNKYAAAGAHLTGRPSVSCEAMTNTAAVFKTSLSTIKQAGDMNFITGITHSVLHGFNYSPPSATYPGWIRYGAFFSENNTLWPHFTHWLDYHARVTTALENTKPAVQIAILGPEADTWSHEGLRRVPFHMEPWYVHELWEGISQNGSSCDYLIEGVIQKAETKNGQLSYGPMNYEVLILAGLKSLSISTAQKVLDFIHSGGKVISIGEWPSRTVTMKEVNLNEKLSLIIQEIHQSDQSFMIAEPGEGSSITDWTHRLFHESGINPQIQMHTVDRSLYQILHQQDDQDFLFLTNTNRKRTIQADFTMPSDQTGYWLWDAEDGSRRPLNCRDGRIQLELAPLKSYFIVSGENESVELSGENLKKDAFNQPMTISAEWDVLFKPVQEPVFQKRMVGLVDFSQSNDPRILSFAGTAVYSTEFEVVSTTFTTLSLGEAFEGVTRPILNGQDLGLRWYGEHIYDLQGALKKGKNQITIEYTTRLWNYCRSLDLPETNRWINNREAISCGLMGPIRLY